MKMLGNLSIRAKLLWGFILVLAVAGAANAFGIWQMNELADLTSKIYNHPLKVTRAAISADVEIVKMHRDMKDVALATDAAGIEAAQASVDAHEQEVYKQLAIVEQQILGAEGAALVSQTIQDFSDWKPIRDEVIDLMEAGQREQAAEITKGKGAQHVALLDSQMGQLREYAATKASGMYTDARSTKNNVTRIAIIALAAVLVGGLGFAWALAGRISRPVQAVTHAATRLAQGDVEQELTVSSGDETGVMAEAFRQVIAYQQAMAAAANRMAQGDLSADVTPQSERDILGQAFSRMIASLRELVQQVQESALLVATSSQEINSASEQSAAASNQVAATIQQIARGSAQQAEDITRTTATVQQVSQAIEGVSRGAQEQASAVSRSAEITAGLSHTIQQVAVNARNGAQDADQAAQTARDGAETIAETIAGMQSIQNKVGLSVQKVQETGKHSEQIGVIVETIDDIAAQTNLLALNAAIEAARAGEHGKGFAVVADEVRKLAENAAQATKEIAELIKGIQRSIAEAVGTMGEGAAEVEAGVGRAAVSRQALENILAVIEAVNRQMDDIATSAGQMDESASEMVRAMDSVSAVVEENTAATEDMALNASQVAGAVENIASISEENSAAAEEVSASVEEASAMAQEVTTSAQTLSAMANDLQALVMRFTLPR
jgi:methyl-accepting chemotaxis protein